MAWTGVVTFMRMSSLVAVCLLVGSAASPARSAQDEAPAPNAEAEGKADAVDAVAEPVAVTQADAAPADAVAEDAGKLRVLALNLEVSGVSPTTASIFQGDIGNALDRYEELDVVTSADLAMMANLEGQRQMLGCEENSCLSELAGALGARYIVYGRLGVVEDIVVLQLNLFDSQQAQIINRQDLRGAGLKATLTQIEEAVDKLIAPIAKSRPAPTKKPDPIAAAQPAPEAEAAADEGGVLGTVLLISGGGLLVVGILGAVAGAVVAGVGEWRLRSKGRAPGEAELWTIAGPVGVIAAGALVVVALGGAGLTVWGVLE
jgi:hypothetical protein